MELQAITANHHLVSIVGKQATHRYLGPSHCAAVSRAQHTISQGFPIHADEVLPFASLPTTTSYNLMTQVTYSLTQLWQYIMCVSFQEGTLIGMSRVEVELVEAHIDILASKLDMILGVG
jgi:hypothetical protein